MQAIHYATDLPALLSAIEQQVEAKAAADYDLIISALQYDINEIISGINSALSNSAGDVNAALAHLTYLVWRTMLSILSQKTEFFQVSKQKIVAG